MREPVVAALDCMRGALARVREQAAAAAAASAGSVGGEKKPVVSYRRVAALLRSTRAVGAALLENSPPKADACSSGGADPVATALGWAGRGFQGKARALGTFAAAATGRLDVGWKEEEEEKGAPGSALEAAGGHVHAVELLLAVLRFGLDLPQR